MTNIERKLSNQRMNFFYINLPIENVPIRQSGRFWFSIFLSPIYKKIAVECDWKSEISQIRTMFDFFWKKMGFNFLKKPEFFQNW